jgi:hypothetical protein
MSRRQIRGRAPNGWRLRLAAATVVLCVMTSAVRGDWFDNFSGNQFHNPTLGSWDFTGYDVESNLITAWRPELENERVEIPSPFSVPGSPAVSLGAAWVESSQNDAHRYRNSRISGTVGVRNNGGLGNNNLTGVLARLDDFDTYVLAIDHYTETINLLKSRTVDPTNPIVLASEQILAYEWRDSYYLTLDVLDVPGGTKLVGKIYDHRGRSTLHNTLFGFDDDGESVPGPTLRPDHSGFFAQVNVAAPQPLPVDAYFDDMWAQLLRPGDVSLDGEVDHTDLARLVANLGQQTAATWDDGDMDGNGQVDMRDLMILRGQLAGAATPVSDSAAVPEPAALTLAILGLSALALSRWRRRVA